MKLIMALLLGFGAAIAAPTLAYAQTGFDFPHKADFLTAGCLTHEYPSMNVSQRAACIKRMKDRRYTHFYIYAYNERDYGGPAFDMYANPMAFRNMLQDIRDAGLKPVVWLHPDDATTNRNRSIASLKARMSDLVPHIDSLVSSYVLGLELNEYWGTTKVDALGKHLNTLTLKKISVHQTSGRWDLCRLAWCDYMMLQYGFGKTTAQIRTMTTQAINNLGKPVVAAEYSKTSEAVSKSLGDAAVSVGARGFGNGGTP